MKKKALKETRLLSQLLTMKLRSCGVILTISTTTFTGSGICCNDLINKTCQTKTKTLGQSIRLSLSSHSAHTGIQLNFRTVGIDQKQELYIKCSAWKGFIPWHYGSPKAFRSENILGLQNIVG